MNEPAKKLSGPDLARGIALSEVTDGEMLPGHAHGEPVLLLRRAGEMFAIGTHRSHYGAPLANGMLVDDPVRCPCHQACYSLRTDDALCAPALDSVASWRVEQQDGSGYVKLVPAEQKQLPQVAGTPQSIAIVGGGAAGNAAAETLRREGYSGLITLLSADGARPCDRPELSKSILAGTTSAESNPLRPLAFYQANRIDLKLDAPVASLDTSSRHLRLVDGSHVAFDALLLATGGEPARLGGVGRNLQHVHYLHSLADGRALMASALTSERAVVIGASFIDLEVAASLRSLNIEVHVVATDSVPMEKLLGPDVGNFIHWLHERHGVTFHLGTTAISIDPKGVQLMSGEYLPADLVIIGIGVRPMIALAERAGLAIDCGITVNEYLETSVPGIFAAGDIARWPDRLTGEHIRAEHWVVAERQGQTAARNMLGRRERFDAVLFFWTEQYDFGLAFGRSEGNVDELG